MEVLTLRRRNLGFSVISERASVMVEFTVTMVAMSVILTSFFVYLQKYLQLNEEQYVEQNLKLGRLDIIPPMVVKKPGGGFDTFSPGNSVGSSGSDSTLTLASYIRASYVSRDTMASCETGSEYQAMLISFDSTNPDGLLLGKNIVDGNLNIIDQRGCIVGCNGALSDWCIENCKTSADQPCSLSKVKDGFPSIGYVIDAVRAKYDLTHPVEAAYVVIFSNKYPDIAPVVLRLDNGGVAMPVASPPKISVPAFGG